MAVQLTIRWDMDVDGVTRYGIQVCEGLRSWTAGGCQLGISRPEGPSSSPPPPQSERSVALRTRVEGTLPHLRCAVCGVVGAMVGPRRGIVVQGACSDRRSGANPPAMRRRPIATPHWAEAWRSLGLRQKHGGAMGAMGRSHWQVSRRVVLGALPPLLGSGRCLEAGRRGGDQVGGHRRPIAGSRPPSPLRQCGCRSSERRRDRTSRRKSKAKSEHERHRPASLPLLWSWDETYGFAQLGRLVGMKDFGGLPLALVG